MSEIVSSGVSTLNLIAGDPDAAEAPEPVELDEGKPFRILIAGDFSGKSWQQDTPPRLFAPRAIDRDNFDEVLKALRISLDVGGAPLLFERLDDFHPDTIHAALPPIRETGASPERPAPPPAAGLLDQIMGEEPSAPGSARAEDANDLEGFIRRVTAGHTVKSESAEERQRGAKRQQDASSRLREILHDPRFQAIEGAWRALWMLVRGLDTDGDLKIYILDVTLPELVGQSAAIRETLAKGGPWGLLAGNFTFGQKKLDAAVLERLADLASALGAPFVAEAEPPGKETPSGAWQELRKSPRARWVGLALPRFLLRLPYGKSTDSIDSFPFEEMPESEHTSYLWGNPAFFCSLLIGQSYLSGGPDFPRRLQRRIDGLPLHVYQQDGEMLTKPCAEVLMTERDAETLLDAGFMPLASLKNQDGALIVRFQSIAMPPVPLAGLG